MGRLEEEADVTTPLKPVPLLFLFRILQLPLATLLLRRDDIYHRLGIMSSHQKTPTKTREEKKEMAVLIALRVSLLSCCRVRLHRGVFHGWLVHRWWRGEFFFSPKRRSKKKKRERKEIFCYLDIRSRPFPSSLLCSTTKKSGHLLFPVSVSLSKFPSGYWLTILHLRMPTREFWNVYGSSGDMQRRLNTSSEGEVMTKRWPSRQKINEIGRWVLLFLCFFSSVEPQNRNPLFSIYGKQIEMAQKLGQ